MPEIAPDRGFVSLGKVSQDIPAPIIAALHFRGERTGLVKQLGGFKKSHHTLPDAANAVTNAFLGKIAGVELTAEAEALFQKIRHRLAYKRADLQLQVAGPTALVTARDFTLEINYALDESAPQHYRVTTTLSALRSESLARTAEFGEVFTRMFSELVFGLQQNVRVEDVIDAIEGLSAESSLTVNYPSDYRDCSITAEGVNCRVRFTTEALSLIFPKPGAPAELLDEFRAVRSAFQINPVLKSVAG